MSITDDHRASKTTNTHRKFRKITETYRNLQRIQKSQKNVVYAAQHECTLVFQDVLSISLYMTFFRIFRIFLIVLIRLDLIIIKIKHMNLAIVHNHPQIFNSFQLFVLIHIHLCMQMHMIRYNQSSFLLFLVIFIRFYSSIAINSDQLIHYAERDYTSYNHCSRHK